MVSTGSILTNGRRKDSVASKGEPSSLAKAFDVQAVPEKDVVQEDLRKIERSEVLPFRRPDPEMDFCGRLPPKKAGNLPINDANDLVAVQYNIGLGEVVVHEAQVRIVVVGGKNNVFLPLLDPSMFDWIWVRDDVGAFALGAGRFYRVQMSQHVLFLPPERCLLGLRDVLPGDVQANSRNSLLDKDVATIGLGKGNSVS